MAILGDDRDVGVPGTGADPRKQPGYRTAASLDSLTGEVGRIMDGPTGRYCYEGRWGTR